ncbi:fimbrial protein [Enterobacter pasteurii]|uniref:fimbrial protein n=1 Tax=Enterobacter pasteurii TaxID=3029761 RepID=UPI0011DD06D6|nr:fimbrial protein [Enterobacter pasteurii]QLA68165.1 fimbrial protein [Enterobacter pasteurii]
MQYPYPYAALLAMCTLGTPGTAWSEVDGEIKAVNGTYEYLININNQDITNNQVGAVVTDEFDLAGMFQGRAYCTQPMVNQPVYYTSKATLTQSGMTTGYLKLNEYMDVKIEIYIGGNLQQYKTVPFDSVSNNVNQNYCNPPSTVLSNQFASGAKGRVTFMITRPIINGVNLQGSEIATLYGRLGPGVMGQTPLSRVTIASGVVTVPDKCIVNQGTPIVVDFGNIPGTGSRLNGINYSQNVPIHVKCQGGSFSQGALNIRLGIQQANPAFEDGKYLSTQGATDRSELGIALRDTQGNPVVPNTFYNVPGFSNNQGDWNLTAAPVAKSATSSIPEGDFHASATVVAEFQ